jgi:hypothetical protein
MGEALPEEMAQDAHDLGPQLEAALVEACGGRLDDIHWFRTDWQRGGAATAYAKARLDGDGVDRDVVIKLPVGPHEHRAATDMSGTEVPAPVVAFDGHELGGWDLGWIVMERIPGKPLSHDLSKPVWRRLFESAAAFSARATSMWELTETPTDWDWPELLDKARQSCQDNPIEHAQEWNNEIKHVQRRLDHLMDVWRHRPITGWCHGDLHPGNMMLRPEGSPWGDSGYVLIDFAESHCGHWVEDAVYVERMHWAKPELLHGAKPVSMLARVRKEMGLECGDDYQLIANVRRILMAAVAPAFLHREGHPAYLEAALGKVRGLLPVV